MRRQGNGQLVVSKMATSQPVPDSRRWRGGKWPKNRHLGVGGEKQMTNDGWSEPLGTKLQQGGHGGTGKTIFQTSRSCLLRTRRSMNYCVDWSMLYVVYMYIQYTNYLWCIRVRVCRVALLTLCDWVRRYTDTEYRVVMYEIPNT